MGELSMEQATSIELREPIEFAIFAPSYKRPHGVTTHKHLPAVKYVVAESEAQQYIDNGLPVWVAPDSAQGNLCRIRNWILDNSECRNILLVDDDFVGVARWQILDDNSKVRHQLTPDQLMSFIEDGFCLAEEIGVMFWGLNCVDDPLSFRDYTPFALTAYIGGPWQAFLDPDVRYDESLPLKEDYDMTLQVLNKHRKVLRFNAYHYFAKQHINQGGCAAYRTLEREREQLALLRSKWGSRIVKTDSGNSHIRRQKENRYDINPIIKIPIKGV